MKIETTGKTIWAEASLAFLLTVGDIVQKSYHLAEAATQNAPDKLPNVMPDILSHVTVSWLALIYFVWNAGLVGAGSAIVKSIVEAYPRPT